MVLRFVAATGMVVAFLGVAGCTSDPEYVDLPSNRGHTLDEALQRLHAVGLRATFPADTIPCGDGLPGINFQSPRAPARVKKGSVVTLTFDPSFIPSPAVPMHHARWAFVPQLVGEDSTAITRLRAIWPCVEVRPATATSASRVVIVAQNPPAGTRVPAYGVMVGRGYRPTTVHLTVAAPAEQ